MSHAFASSPDEGVETRPLLGSERDKISWVERLWRFDCVPRVPARYILAGMGFLGFLNVFLLRANLSMAILQMVNDSSAETQYKEHSYKVYSWTPREKGWVLSAFFYGYLVTQLPGGWLATKFGGKRIFGAGVLALSLLTLLSPLAANVSVWLLVAVRALEGLFEGLSYPGMHSLLGSWAPYSERSILSSVVYTGGYVGTVLSFPLSAILCDYFGWPLVFYVSGCLSVTWCLVWMFTVFDSPDKHPRISLQEKEYICAYVAHECNEGNVPIPWVQILCSPPVWANCIAMFCSSYGSFFLMTCVPLYYKQALNIGHGTGLIENGIFSGIPFLACSIIALTNGFLADFMRSKCFSTQVVRKIFTCTSLSLSGLFVLLCGYFGNSKLIAIALLTLGIGSDGLSSSGPAPNLIDLSPRFAGMLMAIANTMSSLPGIISPQVAEAVVSSTDASMEVYREEWREVFVIAAEVYFFGALVYFILAQGKKQWWADGVDKNQRYILIRRPKHSMNT